MFIFNENNRAWYKTFRLINKVFIVLLSFSGSWDSTVNVSDLTKCISLNNQRCMTRPTLIDLNPDECNQGLSN